MKSVALFVLAASSYASYALSPNGSWACMDAKKLPLVINFADDSTISYFVQNEPVAQNLVGTASRSSQTKPDDTTWTFSLDAVDDLSTTLTAIQISLNPDSSVAAMTTLDKNGKTVDSYPTCSSN